MSIKEQLILEEKAKIIYEELREIAERMNLKVEEMTAILYYSLKRIYKTVFVDKPQNGSIHYNLSKQNQEFTEFVLDVMEERYGPTKKEKTPDYLG